MPLKSLRGYLFNYFGLKRSYYLVILEKRQYEINRIVRSRSIRLLPYPVKSSRDSKDLSGNPQLRALWWYLAMHDSLHFYPPGFDFGFHIFSKK